MLSKQLFIAFLFGASIFGTQAQANSCSNIDVIGTFDESGLRETETGLYATGTFRIFGEIDEAKQPMFNLAMVKCEKKPDEFGKLGMQCEVQKAVVWAQSENPNSEKPNCSLDLDSGSYSMKELQKGVLTGMETSVGCYNSLLTIDRTAQKVFLSFTRTQFADNYDKINPGTCGANPRTQVLMNCTAWPKIRKGAQSPQRYCDFSNSHDR